jgi:hypothetical protein
MPILRMRNATFSGRGLAVAPMTLEVLPGESAALVLASPEEASVVALLAGGIVKATSGSVLIGDFDPRVQSVHCKRIAAFVPHEPAPLNENDFTRYISYRAALWGLENTVALKRASLLRERLDGVHEAFAFPIIGALIGMPQMIVFDRPQAAYSRAILDVTEGRAIFSTHTSAAAANAYARPMHRRMKA